jgi:3-methyladenine DNA glycosylase/8-oxoguanine DNA glycosylase
VDSPLQLLKLAEGWRPYRAYAATYLWAVSEIRTAV